MSTTKAQTKQTAQQMQLKRISQKLQGDTLSTTDDPAPHHLRSPLVFYEWWGLPAHAPRALDLLNPGNLHLHATQLFR
jgi:hypothetical protein